MPLLAGGRDIAAEVAEGLSAVIGAESAGDFLFDLNHSDVSFCQIIVKGNAEVVHEGQSTKLVCGKSVQQIFWWRLFGPSPCFGWRCFWRGRRHRQLVRNKYAMPKMQSL